MKGEKLQHVIRYTFFDIAFFYANLIDYVRCLMGIVATVMIVHFEEWKFCIGGLILGNVLLDWVDGPVARHFGQSTVMGCGWDWFADILAQYNLALWCVQTKSPIALFVSVFTIVEIGTGLFDFAISATSVYPEQSVNEDKGLFFIVEHWLTPGGTYTDLGTLCWLLNTVWPIVYLLDFPAWITRPMLPFALLYAWHEVCQFVFIVSTWKESTASFAGGIQFQRSCKESEVTLLQATFKSCKTTMKLQELAPEPLKEIYWTNLYAEGKFHPLLEKIPTAPQMHVMVLNLLKEMYPPHDPRVILSYGYSIGPKNGKKNQYWHHDYATGVSNLFIPMTTDTNNNCTQFLRTPHGNVISFQPDEQQHYPTPPEMLEREKTTHVEVCQVVSQPFSILKLMPECIHRGIMNGEDYDRIVFFVSTCRADHIPKIHETFDKVID